MILLDTSVWISFLRVDDRLLFEKVKDLIIGNKVMAVSAVFGELLQGAKNTRERENIQSLWESLPKIDETHLFLHAGKISNDFRLHAHGVGLIDCYLLAACIENDLALWTLDKKLQTAFDQVASS